MNIPMKNMKAVFSYQISSRDNDIRSGLAFPNCNEIIKIYKVFLS